MYFTRTQIRALWFIVLIFAAAVLVHYVKIYFFTDSKYDFSEFNQKFIQKRDSLRQLDIQDSIARQRLSGEPEMSDSKTTSSFDEQGLININSANSAQLQTLPRIGPVMAERIITYREQNGQFRSKEDLLHVKGIGKKTLEGLSDLISVK